MQTVRTGSTVSFLENIWSINYVFFTILITFIILPYNSRWVETNIKQKIKRRDN